MQAAEGGGHGKTVAGGMSYPQVSDIERQGTLISAQQNIAVVSGLPSLDKAVRYRGMTCPRKVLANGQFAEFPICQYDPSKLRGYGVGVMLYFKTVKFLGYMFLLYALITSVSMVFFVNGSYFGENTDAMSFSTTTLGNLGYASNTTAAIYSYSPEKISLVVSLADLGGIFLFLLFYKFASWYQESQTAKYEREVITVAQYTVKITGIPPECFDRTEIRNHFISYGDIVDVAIAYNDGEIVKCYMQRGRLKKDIFAAQARKDFYLVASLNEKVESLDKKIENLENRFERRSVCAFVTFNEISSVDKCLYDYPDHWLYRMCMSRGKQFRGYKIRVAPAPEPSNILFLNLCFSKKAVRCRRIFTFIAFLISLTCSVALVYVAQRYQASVPKKSECIPNLTRDQAGNPTAPQQIVDCYCRQLKLTEALKEDLCTSWLRAVFFKNLFLLLASAGIVIVNYVQTRIVDRLGRFERHFSVTSMQSAVTTKLFFTLFLNSSIVAVMVNAYFGSQAAQIGGGILFSGFFEDFSPDWYEAVGVTIMYTMLFNIISPHIFPLFGHCWAKYKRSHRWQKKATQAELNELFSGARFDLAKRYAVVLNLLFVTLLYCSGMPLLLFIAAATCFCIYWFDKTSFLRYYAIPERYDAKLNIKMVSMIPWSIAAHLAVAVWLYSGKHIAAYLPDKEGNVTTTINYIGSGDLLGFRDRISKWTALPSFVLLVALGALRVVKFILSRFSLDKAITGHCKAWAKRTCTCCFTVSWKINDAMSYREARRTVRFESYHLSRQRNYVEAYIQTNSQRQLAPERNLSELGDDTNSPKLKPKTIAKMPIKEEPMPMRLPGSVQPEEDQTKIRNFKRRSKQSHRSPSPYSEADPEAMEMVARVARAATPPQRVSPSTSPEVPPLVAGSPTHEAGQLELGDNPRFAFGENAERTSASPRNRPLTQAEAPLSPHQHEHQHEQIEQEQHQQQQQLQEDEAQGGQEEAKLEAQAIPPPPPPPPQLQVAYMEMGQEGALLPSPQAMTAEGADLHILPLHCDNCGNVVYAVDAQVSASYVCSSCGAQVLR